MQQEETKRFEELYLKHAKYIEHLADECVKMRDKFGTSSALYKSKLKSLQFLREFHDETIDYFNNMQHAFNIIQINYDLLRIRSFAAEVDISINKSLEVLSDKKPLINIENCLMMDDRLNEKLKKEILYIQSL